MRHHTTHTRDAALLRLSRINRWLVAGSIVLTGVLADVAAQAFPGKTKRSSASSTGHRRATHKSAPTGVLVAPEQSPEASTGSESSSGGESSSSESSSGSESSAGSGGGEESSAGSGASEEPSAGSEASEEPSAGSEASEESSGPVVSGGS